MIKFKGKYLEGVIKATSKDLWLLAFRDGKYEVIGGDWSMKDFDLLELMQLGIKGPEILLDRINDLENKLLQTQAELKTERHTFGTVNNFNNAYISKLEDELKAIKSKLKSYDVPRKVCATQSRIYLESGMQKLAESYEASH